MDLRKKILALRDGLSPSQIEEYSNKILENLRQLRPYRECKLPLFFHSFRSEVNTLSEIKRRISDKEQIALPRTLVKEKRLLCYKITSLDQLRPGAFSIMEPDPDKCTRIDPAHLDVVIVPGSVFDRQGGRFGYGGGFYDRFLSNEAPRAIRIGLAFSLQVLDNSLPVKPHDQFMDYIITEKETIICNGSQRKR